MKLVDLLHRWTGGLIGLLLALLGLSGTLLLYKDAYLRAALPHAAEARVADHATLGEVTSRLLASPDAPASILYASDTLGLHRLTFSDERGAYADQAGRIVADWSTMRDRPELWLFDFHHHLLTGDTGETVAGAAGLVGLAFVVTGAILWWRTRRTFRLRLWPKRMSRPAIVTHHRDLGVVMAPILFLSMLTGVMMVFRPVADVVLAPFSPPGTIAASLAAPDIKGGSPDPAAIDWRQIVPDLLTRVPDAELRVVSLPRTPGGLISVRLKRADEWLPNGRTIAWIDPASGRIVELRDALAMPSGVRLFNQVYPVHAGKVGGVIYKMVLTASGLTLFMLGSFAVWTFWTERGRHWTAESRRRRRVAIAAE